MKLLRDIADRARRVTNADGSAAWLVEKKGKGSSWVAASGSLDDGRDAAELLAELAPEVSRFQDGRGQCTCCEPHGYNGAIVSVPFPIDDRYAGGIALQRLNGAPGCSPEALECVRALAECVVAGVARTRLEAEVRAAERLTRAIAATSPNRIIVCDGELRITRFNDAASCLTGRTLSEIIGKHLLTLCPSEMQAHMERVVQTAMTQEAPAAFEVELSAGGGERAPVLLCMSALRDDDGEPHGAVIIAEDLRPSRRAHEQLLQAERLRALGQVASGVAHDLNNVLSAVLARAELLQCQVDNAQVRRGLEVIAKATEDGAHVIERIRDFARTREPRSHRTLDVSAVVRSAVEFTEPQWNIRDADGHGRISCQCELAEGAYVSGSASELRIAICNLLDNAVAAMPGGGALKVSTEAEDGRVRAIVSDTGDGMTPEAQLRAFDPFFTTKGEAGTGLGLWEAHEITGRHGGTITFVSSPGKGATFIVDLPAAPGPPTDNADEGARTAAAGSPCRVLVIDDDAQVLETLVEIISSDGHDVTPANGGAQGLHAFSQREFDLVITDLVMPDMSGWEVARAVRQQAPHVKVAIVTGWGVHVEQEMRDNDVDAIVTKPFQLGQLLDLVRALAPSPSVTTVATAAADA